MDWYQKLRDYINTKFHFLHIFMIGNQTIHIYPTKVFINIPAHILFGVAAAWLSLLVFNDPIVCFYGSCMMSLGINGYQILNYSILPRVYSGILMDVVDGLEYCLGAATVLLLLI